MDIFTIKECSRMSFLNIPFPEVVKKLLQAGVERYICDLVGFHVYYFGIDDQSYTIDFTLKNHPKVASNFTAKIITDSVIKIQQGQIGYEEFLHRIMIGGCSHYEAFLCGKKVIYFGRLGDNHIEYFPKQH
jgi:uncharacterized protein YbcV (DUF1398 family)